MKLIGAHGKYFHDCGKLFSLKLASPIRRGLVHMTGEAFVGDKLVSQAEMLAQIVQDRVPSSASA